jgi:hypothetical protein
MLNQKQFGCLKFLSVNFKLKNHGKLKTNGMFVIDNIGVYGVLLIGNVTKSYLTSSRVTSPDKLSRVW